MAKGEAMSDDAKRSEFARRRAELHRLVVGASQMQGVDVDCTRTDATVYCTLEYGAFHGLSNEDTLALLVVHLAEEKRELFDRIKDDLAKQAHPVFIVGPA
jgi:hypothetical protein